MSIKPNLTIDDWSREDPTKASVEFKGSFWLLMQTLRDLQQMGLMR